MKSISVVIAGALAGISAGQDCPGYRASNIEETGSGLTADLTLAGDACNIYGEDIENLKLIVEYQTGEAPQDAPN